MNLDIVDELKETDNAISIVMSETWTKNCDGVKLFEAINHLSRKITLKLQNGKITIMMNKRQKNYAEQLMQIIKILEDKQYASR